MMRKENRGNGKKDESLAACELSLENCVKEVEDIDRTALDSSFYMKFIRMLSCFDENNLPGELLKSCAEVLQPKNPGNVRSYGKI